MITLRNTRLKWFAFAILLASCGGEDSQNKNNTTSELTAQPTQNCPVPPNYPYATWQGASPDCAPRAFQTQTGYYDPRLQGLQNRTQWIDSGNKTFYDRGPGQRPLPGDIVGYDYDTKMPGYQGHAAVCVGYDANGRCILATGHQNNPYQVKDPSQLDFTYTPAYPKR